MACKRISREQELAEKRRYYFDVWLIPEMRIIVDFGNPEPLIGINSTGQSDNPSSPHYDDGITAWRNGKYQNFPFARDLVEKQYRDKLVLVPKI